jgi:hypothetical protein
MRTFKLDEISVVDKPAQAGAVATIMKRVGDLITKGQPMTPVQKLRSEMAAIDRKLDRILKATDPRNRERRRPSVMTPERASEVLQPYAGDLRNQPRGRRPKVDEEEYYPEAGEEFEKEPDEDEDEDDGIINTLRGDPKETTEDHEGDWYGAGTKGTARDHISGTRADDYVSGDESDELGTEEDEDELAAAITAKATDLMKRDSRLSPETAAMMAAARVTRTMPVGKSAAHGRPLYGCEREYRRREQDAAIAKARQQYGTRVVKSANGRDYTVRTQPTYAQAVAIAKRSNPHLFD